MLTPIITPSHTAVMFAVVSASRMGAIIGTTTTAISIKSRKKPRTKITAITTMNLVMNPPGRPDRNSRTRSSPPKARNAAVSIAAPSRMIKTSDVVLAVSIITPLRVSSVLYIRHRLQNTATSSIKTAMAARITPTHSSPVRVFLILMS